ncbi:hypothetical protein JTE90_021660 [Oedothorax gibbosus]|uniref:Uncharacterized protein n=1 Tax=Oedothorax gibbosus TaxID=931172 RepID=A0AAV6VP68_9ARAC|nr:hypothetical protein JTE90_021660 [Oedothorax gibbosus]
MRTQRKNKCTNGKVCKCCQRWYKAAKEAKDRNDTELKILSNNIMDQIDACPQKLGFTDETHVSQRLSPEQQSLFTHPEHERPRRKPGRDNRRGP